MVKVEGAGQSGTRLDDGGGAVVVGGRGILSQKLATDALMVAFSVVVSDVFTNETSQVGFTKDDEVIEALIANGLDEALSVSIAVQALRRDGDAGDAATGEGKLPVPSEQRIAIVNQELSAAKETIG